MLSFLFREKLSAKNYKLITSDFIRLNSTVVEWVFYVLKTYVLSLCVLHTFVENMYIRLKDVKNKKCVIYDLKCAQYNQAPVLIFIPLLVYDKHRISLYMQS